MSALVPWKPEIQLAPAPALQVGRTAPVAGYMASVTVDTRQGLVILTATAEKDFVAAEAVRRGAKQIMLPKGLSAAKSLVMKMRNGDAKAKADAQQILALARSGDQAAIKALVCLQKATKMTKGQGANTSGWLGDTHARGLALLLGLARRGHPKALRLVQAAKTGSWRSLAPYAWGGAPNVQDLAEIVYDAAPPEVQAMVQDKAKFKDMVQKLAATKMTASFPGAPKTGYYPFPSAARAGIDMAARQLTPARIQQLKSLMHAARYSAPKQLMARTSR